MLDLGFKERDLLSYSGTAFSHEKTYAFLYACSSGQFDRRTIAPATRAEADRGSHQGDPTTTNPDRGKSGEDRRKTSHRGGGSPSGEDLLEPGRAMKKILFFAALIISVLALGAADAQSPVIVQPANSVPANAAAAAPAAAPVAAAPAGASDLKSMLADLQAMQTKNDETIKKQEAALATLDELQKAVEELKVFSKRG